MRGLPIALCVFAVSCGKGRETTWPNVVSPTLASEVSRISPRLLWCDGQATSPRKNNIDGRPACDVGDAMTDTGMLLALGNFVGGSQLQDSIIKSIATTGQPYRAPSYVGRDIQNEFSRDQFIGLADATAAGLDEKYLNSVLDYYSRTGSLCPNATDSRCKMTPSMITLADDVRKRNVTLAERALDEATLAVEAKTVPLDYEAYLVSRKIFTRAILGKLTDSYASSAKALYNRAPNNMWLNAVFLMTNSGTQQEFDALGAKLASCMAKWEKPGHIWLGRKGNTLCPAESIGHDLVALATFLQLPPRGVK